MNEQLGIVDSLYARRESLVERLSPAARHAAFPQIYARPGPTIPPAEVALKQKVDALEGENRKLTRENARLRTAVAELQIQLTTAATAAALRMSQRTQDPPQVIEAFLAAINAGRDADKAMALAALTSSRRSRNYSAPRHVCMWLVRQLSTHMSLPRIGKCFGGRDHTTVMHACKRAPFWLLTDPELKAAADVVLARFAATGDDT